MRSAFWWGSQRETDQLKDIDVEGNDIKWILKMRWGDEEWIDLAQNTEM